MQTRAVVFKERDGGSCGDFEIIETFQCPEEKDHCVTVKVKACGLSESNKKLKLLKEFGLSDDKEIPVGREISGIVTSKGSNVQRFSVGDEVFGIIPLSSGSAGCANFCVLSEFDLVVKPEKVSHVDAAGLIGDGVKAYSAIHYQAKLCGGEAVLVFDGASSSGVIIIQLAQAWGAKVLATASTEEEVLLLESFQPQLSRVIDLRKSQESIVDICMMETGGLGIDCIIDNGAAQYSDEFIKYLSESELDKVIGHNPSIPCKHDIISCLAVGGRWITQQVDLQLDPPDSKLLFAKGACVGFLFEDVWTVSRGQQGRYLHILNDLMDKFLNSLVRPVIHHTVSLDDCCKTLKNLRKNKVGKVVVTM